MSFLNLIKYIVVTNKMIEIIVPIIQWLEKCTIAFLSLFETIYNKKKYVKGAAHINPSILWKLSLSLYKKDKYDIKPNKIPPIIPSTIYSFIFIIYIIYIINMAPFATITIISVYTGIVGFVLYLNKGQNLNLQQREILSLI